MRFNNALARGYDGLNGDLTIIYPIMPEVDDMSETSSNLDDSSTLWGLGNRILTLFHNDGDRGQGLVC